MIKQYVVDAFADKLFQGNPAAVCILDTWLADDLLEAITMENNLSETAFAVKEGSIYHLRWFTPGGEIDLCEHATLATAFVIKNFYEQALAEIVFETLSGKLFVGCQNNLFCLNFPSYDVKEIPVTQEMVALLGVQPSKAYLSRDLVCVMENEKQVLEYVPDLVKIKQLDGLILHLTTKGSNYDCITRTFAPKLNVDEDPVCGSGHCLLAPIWSKELGKTSIKAYQASKRGGTLYCEYLGERTTLSGKAVLFSVAELFID